MLKYTTTTKKKNGESALKPMCEGERLFSLEKNKRSEKTPQGLVEADLDKRTTADESRGFIQHCRAVLYMSATSGTANSPTPRTYSVPWVGDQNNQCSLLQEENTRDQRQAVGKYVVGFTT